MYLVSVARLVLILPLSLFSIYICTCIIQYTFTSAVKLTLRWAVMETMAVWNSLHNILHRILYMAFRCLICSSTSLMGRQSIHTKLYRDNTLCDDTFRDVISVVHYLCRLGQPVWPDAIGRCLLKWSYLEHLTMLMYIIQRWGDRSRLYSWQTGMTTHVVSPTICSSPVLNNLKFPID